MEFCCQYVGGWGYPTSRGSVITIILSIGKVHGLRLTEVHVHLMMRITSRSLHSFCSEHVLPALCKTPTARSRPEGEGANLDRHLVPYHVKQGESNLASSLFIYYSGYCCSTSLGFGSVFHFYLSFVDGHRESFAVLEHIFWMY